MATLKATGGSLLGMVSAASEAITSGVTGSSIWFSEWANAVQERSQTQRELTSRVEAGKRALVNERAAEEITLVIKQIATTRSKDPEAYDQAVKILQGLTT